LNYGSEHFAVLVPQNDIRSNEIRAALGSAARVLAMAKAAVSVVKRFAARNRGGVSRGMRREGISAAPAAPVPFSRVLREQAVECEQRPERGDGHQPHVSTGLIWRDLHTRSEIPIYYAAPSSAQGSYSYNKVTVAISLFFIRLAAKISRRIRP
jgi:hypothetical protein